MNLENIQKLTLNDLGPSSQQYRDSYLQSDLRKLTPEQLPQDNETRWLLLYPPEYNTLSVNSGVSSRVAEAANQGYGLGNQYWLDMFKEADNRWEAQRQQHLELLRIVYKTVTHLPGITVWHDPKYIMRDINLLKRRVLLNDSLQIRLAEIEVRDSIAQARQFSDYRNEGYICTITSVRDGAVFYKANFKGANLASYDLQEFKKLSSIGVRKLRLI